MDFYDKNLRVLGFKRGAGPEVECRPYGTRAFSAAFPALPCRAFTWRRYATWVGLSEEVSEAKIGVKIPTSRANTARDMGTRVREAEAVVPASRKLMRRA